MLQFPGRAVINFAQRRWTHNHIAANGRTPTPLQAFVWEDSRSFDLESGVSLVFPRRL